MLLTAQPARVALEGIGQLSTKQPEHWLRRVSRRYRQMRRAKKWLVHTITMPDGSVRTLWNHFGSCQVGLRPNGNGSVLGVQLLGQPGSNQGYLGGLMTCGQYWICPVCAAIIAEQRKREIAEALEAHRSNAGRVLFITLTASHHHTPLKTLLDLMCLAVGRVYTGGQFTRWKTANGYVGSIRATEIMWSDAHGWHPHFHILWMFDPGEKLDLSAIEQYCRQAWMAALAAVGLSASSDHGVDIKASDWTIEEYISKIGHEREWDLDAELTLHQHKGSKRTGLHPFDLLDIGEGLVESCPIPSKARCRALFREYAHATAGHHSLRWSPGLRAKLGLTQPKTDKEAAESQLEHEIKVEDIPEGLLINLGYLKPDAWRVVLANDCIVELRIAAGSCDPTVVDRFCHQLGISWTCTLGRSTLSTARQSCMCHDPP